MRLKVIDYIFVSLILSIVFVYFSQFSLNVDSTWILHCAKEILSGNTMYIDMIDVNPPLIFIYSTLAILICDFVNIPILNSYVILVLTIIFTSTFLCAKVLININFKVNNGLRYYLYIIFFILTISISFSFGQREHLFIIFILPYVMMIAYQKKSNVSNFSKIIIAIFASLGFNLKPHFFLVFILIEIMYIIYKKDISLVFRKESIIIFSSAFLYMLLIYFYFPVYLNFVVPFSIETYIDIFNKPLEILILNYEFNFTILSLIFFIFLYKDRFSFSNNIFLLSILSSIFIYLIQQKGWSYHRVPFLVLTLIFITHLSIIKYNKNSIFFIILIPFIATITYHNAYYNNIIRPKQYSSLKAIINKIPKKSSILIVSTDIAEGIPQLKKDQIWASRFPSMFMLPSIKKKKNQKVKDYTFNSIFNDLIKYKPNYIIFSSRNKNFNYYNFYITQDKRIKNYFLKYYKMSTINNHITLTKQNNIKIINN